MTKDTISETAALKALLSETADHQILAEMLGFVADRAGEPPKRVSSAPVGDLFRSCRCSEPEAAQRDVFSRVSGTASRFGKGNDRSDPGGLYSGCFNAISR